MAGERICERALPPQGKGTHCGCGLDTRYFDFSKGGKTGGVDTPALLNELMQHHLSELAEQCHGEKTGYVIGRHDQKMNHTAFRIFAGWTTSGSFAHNTTTLQTMIDDLTHSLHHNLGMQWKPKSMQVMYAAHMHRNRNVVTARARLTLDMLQYGVMTVEAAREHWWSSDGQQRILQIRGAAEGSEAAHCRADKGIRHCLCGSTLHWLGNASPGQYQPQEIEGLGRALHQDHEAQQERHWQTHQHYMKRTEDALDGICSQNEILRVRIKALRLHKWARVALNLQWSSEECFPAQGATALQRSRMVGANAADEGLRKRNCEATRKHRHGTNVPMRWCETPFVEVFGVNWK